MEQENQFSFWRGLRLSSFQIGSAMGDILVTSIWNRILIVTLGIPATPVGLLIALRYLLSPLSLWAGHLTDNQRFFGLHRTPLIWLGRALMVLSLPLLGLSVMRLSASTVDVLGWIFALLSSLMYGVGTLISGSPFLALVRESAPERRQGTAISLVETVLIIFFAVAGIVFSIWMPAYEPRIFWEMIAATMVIGGFFWFFAVAGVERRDRSAVAEAGQGVAVNRLGDVIREIWGDRRTRLFFVFLSLATLSAWAQDAILEPFGADTFGLSMGQTTRFNSYWQTATVITLIAGGLLWRKRPPERQGRIAAAGLAVMALGLALLAVAGFSGQRHLIELALLIFGGGFGIYTFGGLSLMAVMSPDRHAGAYLGLWSISILVFKGLGTFLGGALRDLSFLQLGLPAGLSYGVVFLLQALGLAAAILVLSRIDILAFARESGRHVDRVEAQAAAAD
ncbi:MAG: BCD family MFS transporter [Anaerolineae bacterium]|uniref:BCD family MFS transporter n=1 Tax=Promineifilum sp. TaxID=2664178 RepID=UPI001D511775|nr:BCD family MFS transporter [Anaerolineales bacterium]MCB8935982.1 BCD family MFS transporter [Promineifilum sp.]MCO5181657.1 BCD family MFS transporter [Promineifilum sp.]MCW5848199.1 BCD family MFS transporter [Anaerolineae bacterium]